MAGRFPWFPFLVEDWLSSELYNTQDALVHGIFWNACALLWSSSSCSIAEPTARILTHRILPASIPSDLRDKEIERISQAVIREFIPHPYPSCDGLLTHPKLFDLWEERIQKSESAKARGSLGGKKKARGVAIAKLKGSDPDPDPDPDPEKKEKTPLPPAGERAFSPEDLLSLYELILPELPKPKRPIGSGVRKAIATAIKRDGQDPKAWGAYFQSIRGMPFLMGRDMDFTASLPWLLGPKNRAKVEGGAYVKKGKGVAADWDDPSTSQGWGNTPVFDNRD